MRICIKAQKARIKREIASFCSEKKDMWWEENAKSRDESKEKSLNKCHNK